MSVFDTLDDAERAGDIFCLAIITLGGRGVLFHAPGQSVHVPAVSCGPAIDTTGAGDAFVGGFAAALSRGAGPLQAVRFGCATAGIAVTRRGTAPAMPMLSEIETVMAR